MSFEACVLKENGKEAIRDLGGNYGKFITDKKRENVEIFGNIEGAA